MIDVLLVLIGLIGLVVASISDLKTREVPDWLNFSMISIGISLRLMQAISTNAWKYMIYTIIAVASMFILGSIMYYTKQWGGGDTKLLIAIAAIFAVTPNQNLFLVSLIINLAIISTLYGLSWCIYFSVKNRKKFAKELPIYLHKNKLKIEKFLIASALVLLPLLLVNDPSISYVLLIISVMLALYPLLATFIEAVERSAMFKEVRVSSLTEGDWITKDIRDKNRLVYSKASPGIEKHQINILKKLQIKYVPVKEGIPFVPAFLISTVITLSLGNLVLFFL